jgi:hypothetical protein
VRARARAVEPLNLRLLRGNADARARAATGPPSRRRVAAGPSLKQRHCSCSHKRRTSSPETLSRKLAGHRVFLMLLASSDSKVG